MRIAVAALGLLAACSSGAQAACQYDLYIYQPTNGHDVYAIVGAGRAAAVEVRGCGDARLLTDAAALVEGLQARRLGGGMDVVTVHGRGSRTYLDYCSGADDDKDEEEAGDDEDNLVVIEGASAVQMRRTLQTLDAAPPELRQRVIDSLGMNTCARR